MNVLFVFFTDPPTPFSSSVAGLASVAREAGWSTRALSVPRKSRIDDAVQTIAKAAPDVVAISSMTRDWPGAHTLALRVREQTSAYIVVGGYHASLAPQTVAACEAVDAICIGEGERPLTALLGELERGRPAGSLPGLWVRGVDGWTDPLPAADPVPDVARLPRWDYDIFGDMRAHLARGINTFGPHADGYLPTRAGRGCPYNCAYCSAPAWGKLGGFASSSMRNTRPVTDLCEELAELRDRYAPEGFEFWDEHFPIKLDWLAEFAELYPARVGIPFKCEMHPAAATHERLALLKQAGCSSFHCGVEAGDAQLRQQTLNRRTSDALLQRVFDDARALGLPTSASLMTSLPGETRAQAHATVRLLRDLRPDSFMWSTYQALPGTVLGKQAIGAWPEPARERFDDSAQPAARFPTAQDEAERGETFAELTQLQRELVQLASQAVQRPVRAREVDIPRPREARVPPRLLARLQLGDPEAPLEDGPRVNFAVWEAGALTMEIEAESVPACVITIGDAAVGRHYKTQGALGVSYRGSEAGAGLLKLLDDILGRLAGADIETLRAACSD